jgi:capsular polysaccharide biosynthesis protein
MPAHRSAFLLPGARIDRRTTSLGVYGADGAVLADCAIATASWTNRPPDRGTPVLDAPLILGPALFAGSVDKQFGFVLLNALGRLWALDHLPAETVIVYAAKPQAKPPGYGVVGAVLRALGLTQSVLITQGPLRLEQLHSAQERFGECRGATGAPEFYDWIDQRWPAAGPPDPHDRIYVSRSGLGPKAGRFACEDHLETLLIAQGYRVYHPQDHDVAHQVATFQSAGQLIFAEGSALHLFALVRRPGQVSAVIHRRPDLPVSMLAQMADRTGPATQAVNAVQQQFWPPQRGEHLGLSVLDFDTLGDALVAQGLVSRQGWSAPARDAVQASLRAGLALGEPLMTATERSIWLKAQRDARQKG